MTICENITPAQRRMVDRLVEKFQSFRSHVPVSEVVVERSEYLEGIVHISIKLDNGNVWSSASFSCFITESGLPFSYDHKRDYKRIYLFWGGEWKSNNFFKCICR